MRPSKKAFSPAAASPCCVPPLGSSPKGSPHDEEVGYNIVLRACRAPLTTIANNAGQDGGIVCEKVLEAKGNIGYNAATDEYEDLVKAGVIDPTKVTRTALQNAASVATLLLTSDALIAEKPKKRSQEGRRRRPRRRLRHVLIRQRAESPGLGPGTKSPRAGIQNRSTETS